jgi:hypothetical protein
MHLQNIISKISKWIGLFALFFCFFLNNQVFAQSDRETVIQERENLEMSKKIKSPQTDQGVPEEENSYAPKNNEGTEILSNKTSSPKGQNYREDGVGLEEKKVDKAPVSFNIFLYVLDRFKEN